MHLPDEFLNTGTAGSLLAGAAFAVSVAIRSVRRAFLENVPVLKRRLATFPDFGGESGVSFQHHLTRYGKERLWRMAAVGSIIFAAQMVNFPIGGGTSGHLLGGVLAAIIVGPFEALLVMSVIFAMQALVFGDGGIVALGANIFNMGIVGALEGYAFLQFLMRGSIGKKKFFRSVFVAAWVSVITAAFAASFEIAFSGVEPFGTVLPAMVLSHTAIGFMEGVITVSVLSILLKRGYPLAAFEKQETFSYEKKNYEKDAE